MNHWIEQGYFCPDKAGEFKPIKIRIIRMSKAYSDSLSYSTKLSREADFIEDLIHEGEAQATAFLKDLEGPVAKAVVS